MYIYIYATIYNYITTVTIYSYCIVYCRYKLESNQKNESYCTFSWIFIHIYYIYIHEINVLRIYIYVLYLYLYLPANAIASILFDCLGKGLHKSRNCRIFLICHSKSLVTSLIMAFLYATRKAL